MQKLDITESIAHGAEGLANYLERKFLTGLRFAGERRAFRFARVVAPLFTLSRNSQRRRNLERFFGPTGWDAARRREFERAYYDYLARLFAEQACLVEGCTDQFHERVMLSGVHHVEEALKLGRGALVLSGHIGNYRFIPAVLARQGYDVVALVRSVPLSGNERYLNRLATRYNFRLVFTYQNAIETFRTVLRNNGIIYIAFDTVALENSSTWLPFGQTSLALSKGPALLACRYRVPVLYGVAPQESCGRTAIAVKPVEPLAIEKNGHTTPEELAAVWLRHLHADIMRYPEQWWEWPFQTIEGPDFAHRDAALAPQPIPLTLESAS